MLEVLLGLGTIILRVSGGLGHAYAWDLPWDVTITGVMSILITSATITTGST